MEGNDVPKWKHVSFYVKNKNIDGRIGTHLFIY